MGRKESKRSLDLQEFTGQMVGIVSTADKTTLDEAPGAYKEINTIIAYQEGVHGINSYVLFRILRHYPTSITVGFRSYAAAVNQSV
jgi:RNA-splicing ligase RtcB